MSFIFTILIWIGLYFLESKKGIWISDSPIFQVIMCWIYFMNAFVMVKRGQTRELIFRPTQRLLIDLRPGIYFFPFLWWWGEVEEDYEPQKSSFIHIDTRQVFRKRELVGRWGWFEDVSREFLIPFILRRSLWAIVICFILAYFIGTYSVKLKHKYFVDYFPKREVSKENNSTSYPSTNYSATTQNSYSSSSSSEVSNSNQNAYNANDVQEVQQSQKEVWPPPESYNSARTWDNLQLDDNYTAVASLNKGVNYVEEEGFFVSFSRSKNYYPHVYVDGFSEDNDFFCKFFTVHINRLTFNNGEAWNNVDMNLCDYIEIVKDKKKVGEGQYRSIKIMLKNEFSGKYKWHLVSAGFGNENSDFRLFLGDQSTSSNAEAKRKSDIEQNKADEIQRQNNIAEKRQQEAREAEQRSDYNEQTRIMRASIRFIPHIILNGYDINTVSQYLLKGYKISYDRNSDGSFIILNDFNSVIQEEECFYFTFACRGFLYHSDNRKRFDGAMNKSLENDANISANLPEYVYVINGRKFNFDGSRY